MKSLVLSLLLLAASTAAFAQPAASEGDTWLVRAGEHLKAGRNADAIAAYGKAWDLGANGRFVAGYNLACLHARAGHADDAFAWLEKIHTLGVRPEQLAKDDDLAPLQKDPRWQPLMDRIDARVHPCRAPRFRELDFWVGTWDVANVAGQKVGESRIEKILDGCVIEENWAGRLGDTGKSFNLYDAANDRWQQTWVSDKGALVEYRGKLVDGAMRYAADATAPHRRLSFIPLPDGRVRQLAEQSTDGGATWNTTYDFFYRRKAGTAGAPAR